jgi:hypothetical protein
MSGVRRTKDAIDIFERTMEGVHTADDNGRIEGFRSGKSTVGLGERHAVRAFDDTGMEREVIVKMPRAPHRRRSR